MRWLLGSIALTAAMLHSKVQNDVARDAGKELC